MAISYSDRLGNGRQLSDVEIVKLVADAPVGGGTEWRHIGVSATILAESNGYEWIRPIVFKPDTVYHLSVDRGICQFNSARHPDGTPATYWAAFPDHIAYSPKDSIYAMVEWLHTEAHEGTKGARSWDWRPLLDWQWHGFVDVRDTSISQDRKDRFITLLGRARIATNEVRRAQGLQPL